MGQNQTKTAGPNTLAKRAKRAAKQAAKRAARDAKVQVKVEQKKRKALLSKNPNAKNKNNVAVAVEDDVAKQKEQQQQQQPRKLSEQEEVHHALQVLKNSMLLGGNNPELQALAQEIVSISLSAQQQQQPKQQQQQQQQQEQDSVSVSVVSTTTAISDNNSNNKDDTTTTDSNNSPTKQAKPRVAVRARLQDHTKTWVESKRKLVNHSPSVPTKTNHDVVLENKKAKTTAAAEFKAPELHKHKLTAEQQKSMVSRLSAPKQVTELTEQQKKRRERNALRRKNRNRNKKTKTDVANKLKQVQPDSKQVWEEYFDDSYQTKYYFNTETKTSQWERPQGCVIIAKIGAANGDEDGYTLTTQQREQTVLYNKKLGSMSIAPNQMAAFLAELHREDAPENRVDTDNNNNNIPVAPPVPVMATSTTALVAPAAPVAPVAPSVPHNTINNNSNGRASLMDQIRAAKLTRKQQPQQPAHVTSTSAPSLMEQIRAAKLRNTSSSSSSCGEVKKKQENDLLAQISSIKLRKTSATTTTASVAPVEVEVDPKATLATLKQRKIQKQDLLTQLREQKSQLKQTNNNNNQRERGAFSQANEFLKSIQEAGKKRQAAIATLPLSNPLKSGETIVSPKRTHRRRAVAGSIQSVMQGALSPAAGQMASPLARRLAKARTLPLAPKHTRAHVRTSSIVLQLTNRRASLGFVANDDGSTASSSSSSDFSCSE